MSQKLHCGKQCLSHIRVKKSGCEHRLPLIVTSVCLMKSKKHYSHFLDVITHQCVDALPYCSLRTLVMSATEE